jgi:Tol biopolymer transport system component
MQRLRSNGRFLRALILSVALAGCSASASTQPIAPRAQSSHSASIPAIPDSSGGLIVFRRGVDETHSSIFTVGPDGSAMTELVPTPSGDNDTHPWLSPDGRQVIFQRRIHENHITSSSDAPEHDVLMVVNTDGSGLHQLTPACAGACASQCAMLRLPCPGDDYPSWSPDGTRIAFERAYGPDLAHLTVAIWVAHADGSHAVQLTHPQPGISEDHSPSWSPDGRHIVFAHFDDSAPNGGLGSIETIDPDGTHQQIVYTVPSKWPFGGGAPRWSPDGSKILFSTFCFGGSPDTCPPDTPSTGAHLFTIRPDGTGLTELTHGSTNTFFPTWSPDGSTILFSESPRGFDGSPDIYVMDANGSHARPFGIDGCPCITYWGSAP